MMRASIERRALLRLAAFALAPTATGCSGLIPGSGAPPQLYVLMRKTTFPPDLPTLSRQLLVDTPVAPAHIDTTRVPLTRSPTTFHHFPPATCSDRPPPMAHSLLIPSLHHSA